MFESVVAEVQTGLLDDQTGRDVVALAKKLVSPSGKLTLLHVRQVKRRPHGASPAREAGAPAAALRWMERLAVELSVEADLRCVEALSPRRGLHGFAARQASDLLVVGAGSGIQGSIPLGIETGKALGDTPCAVAIAPAGFAARARATKTIAVGVDGSSASERAVAVASRLAAELRAELSAFEVSPVEANERDPWNVRRQVGDHLRPGSRRVDGGKHLGAKAGFDYLVRELARQAKSVDLLVLGGHDYRPIDHVLALSTAQRLVGGASSPLLVLPAADKLDARPLPDWSLPSMRGFTQFEGRLGAER